MLGHLHAGGGDDDGGGGGNIKCSALIAAGAAGVDDDFAGFAGDGDGFFAHDRGCADEFFDGAAFGGQANE